MGTHAQEMPNDLARLWLFLKERYKDKESATPRAGIIARYNLLHPIALSDRAFRDQVSELVRFPNAQCKRRLALG